MALEALIFDFDGTVAETERDGHRVAYNEAFADLGFPWRWGVEEYGRLLAVAGGKERLAHYFSQQSLAPGIDPASLAARIHARKIERFTALAPTLTFRPGFVRVVAEAKAAGIRLAIATTAHEGGVRDVLAADRATLVAFDLIAAGDVVPNKKPAPDIYAYALERLGVGASAAIAFEDSAIGLRAARAAGLTTVVTPSIYTQDESFAGAASVLSSLGDTHQAAIASVGASPPQGIVDLSFLRSLLS